MSVGMTQDQVRARIKTETRRKGWWEKASGVRILHPGDTLHLVDQVMGFRKGEHPVRICDVRVVDVRRERLNEITPEGVAAEGFPGMDPGDFIYRFFIRPQGMLASDEVTVIKWEYLP